VTVITFRHRPSDEDFLNFNPFLFLATAAMLVGGRDWRTQFWKRIANAPFHRSFVLSGQVVSEEKIF
jgi:hypothetical protein